MKGFLFRFLVFTLVTSVSYGQVDLFDGTVLHEIRISSDDPNFWQKLDDDYAAWFTSGNEIPYHSVTVEIDGLLLQDVGIRQKGFSSNFFVTTTKKPLKLNFGKFVTDREYQGVRKVNLMNGVGDPAIAKDKLVYDMFRMHGVAGPRVAHTKVYINEEFWGIYALIEQVDKRYLKRNFADKKGNLWKNKGYSELNWTGPNIGDYSFELQTNQNENDWAKFFSFVEFINTSSDFDFSTQLAGIFELDEYFRILAIDIITNNWDSYLLNGRNWYLYYEPKTDKIHWLPWDYNFAFDRNPDGTFDIDLIQNNPNKILVERIFKVPEYKTRVLDYMCEILEINFTNSRIDPILDDQLALVINEWGASNDFFTIDFLNNFINNDVWADSNLGPGNQGMKKFVTDRSAAVLNDLNALGHTCTALNSSINPKDVVINEFMARNEDNSQWFDQDGDFDDWIELYNNTENSIALKNYFLSDSLSFIHKWRIPDDAVIPANGYLIIWADRDPHQNGLHSKFNLDKDGGDIYLSYIDNTIIDNVSYEEQEGNVSLSRMPNGTGVFVNSSVTFNNQNIDNVSIFASSFE